MRDHSGSDHEHEQTRVAGRALLALDYHAIRRACRGAGNSHHHSPPKRGSPSTPARRRWIAATAQQANDLFRTAVAADPNFTYAWFNLSNVTFSTEEFNAALHGGGAGRGARPVKASACCSSSTSCSSTNNFDAQLELAQQLTEKYPNSPRAWLVLAGGTGGAEQVRRAARHAREGDRAGAGVLARAFRAGGSYLFNDPKDFAKAEKYYRQAIAIAPGIDMYYWSLGDVYRGSNRLEEARRYYKLALQLDPKDLDRADQARPREFLPGQLRRGARATMTAASRRAARRTPASSRRSRRSPGCTRVSRRRR